MRLVFISFEFFFYNVQIQKQEKRSKKGAYINGTSRDAYQQFAHTVRLRIDFLLVLDRAHNSLNLGFQME